MLDCSGTTMDRYVDAPAIVFVEVFRNYGLEISMPEARAPMGLRKDLHIKAITEIASVRGRFVAQVRARADGGRCRGDVRRLRADAARLLRKGNYHELLPAWPTSSMPAAQGIKIGVTTGFTRDMLDILLAGGARQGSSRTRLCRDESKCLARPHTW